MKKAAKQYSFIKILQLAERSKGWLSKWLHRYKEQGINGLKDKSSTLIQIWKKTSYYMVKKIFSIGDELESLKTCRSAFSGIGAEVIRWELEQRMVCNVLSLSTIANILSCYG